MDSQDALRSKHRVTQLIGLAMAGSFLLYLGLVLALPTLMNNPDFQGFQMPAEKDAGDSAALILRYALLGVGLMTAALSFVLKGIIVQKAKTAAELLTALQISSIVAYALSEASAVMGLVLFLLQGARVEFFFLWVVGLGAFVSHLPRLSDWEEKLRRLN